MKKCTICPSNNCVSSVKMLDNICCGSRYVTEKFHNQAAIQINQIRISTRHMFQISLDAVIRNFTLQFH